MYCGLHITDAHASIGRTKVGVISDKGKKGKGRYSSSWEPHLRATGRHLPYGITQCYLPPDTSERTPPNPSHAGWYSIYLPRRDGRLSWPSWLDSAPAGSRTSDLSITSPTPNRCTTKVCFKQHTTGLRVWKHLSISFALDEALVQISYHSADNYVILH